MEITTSHRNAGTVVMAVAGRLDALTSPQFEREVLALLSAETRGMVLDFSRLDYISSAGLRALILGAKKAKSGGAALVLFGLNPQITDVFDVSGFSSIFTVLPGEAEALALVDSRPGA